MVVVAGASGNTGSRTVSMLLKRGEKVLAFARSAEKLTFLKDQGAQIRTGDLGNVDFLTSVLKDADAAYLLIPPRLDAIDIHQYYIDMAQVIFNAIVRSGIKKMVFLSSLGAEKPSDTGVVLGLHDVEIVLGRLTHVDIVFLRCSSFMQNTLSSISLIKQQHFFGGIVDPNIPVYMCDTRDIGDKAAELLAQRAFPGHSVLDLFGDRLSFREASHIIGMQIGMPDLPYIRFKDTDALAEYVDIGFSQSVAQSYIDLARAISQGKINPTITDPSKPTTTTTFLKFVKEVFLPFYNKK
ncbi:MAG TPA: NAD(P)H-binding protein [Chitinispirillaceae bacterium]|nr:NAD(P)H-binding protein [Chitinispirillaceae bacterium]